MQPSPASKRSRFHTSAVCAGDGKFSRCSTNSVEERVGLERLERLLTHRKTRCFVSLSMIAASFCAYDRNSTRARTDGEASTDLNRSNALNDWNATFIDTVFAAASP